MNDDDLLSLDDAKKMLEEGNFKTDEQIENEVRNTIDKELLSVFDELSEDIKKTAKKVYGVDKFGVSWLIVAELVVMGWRRRANKPAGAHRKRAETS